MNNVIISVNCVTPPKAKALTFVLLETHAAACFSQESGVSENHLKKKAMFLQSYTPDSKINPGISGQKPKTGINYAEVEKELNSKILNITLKINEHYPELSKYLEEMPVTIPVYKKPEITLHILSAYYKSLDVMLNTYIKEHS